MKITNRDISEHANIEDTKLNTIKTKGKVSNCATTATVHSHPNTIVLRDNDGASRLTSVVFTGANYLHKHVNSSLLTNGFIYLTNKHHTNYAMLRNITENCIKDSSNNVNDCCKDDDSVVVDPDVMNLSLDIGQNNLSGNFNIRTIQNDLITNNFCIKNNNIGINTDNPVYKLDISGNVRVSTNLKIDGTLQMELNKGIIASNEIGELYSKIIETSDLSDNLITTPKLDTNLHFTGYPTCNTNPFDPLSIVNVDLLMTLFNSITSITHIYSKSQAINFDYARYVIECEMTINLPTFKKDGSITTFINKSNTNINFISTEPMYNILYSPNGMFEFFVPNHRQINLTYIKSLNGNSWMFNLN
jgi:hypothetical protein